jgi:hypothetical protein
MILKAECPFCEWNARQEVGDRDRSFIRSYLGKALMTHLHLKHVRPEEGKVKGTNVAFSTIMGKETGMGMVEMSINDELTQMDLDKAREVHRMLGECIEAAVSDWLIHKFFTERMKLEPEKAAAVLMDFRELRHGSVKGGGNAN